MNTDIRSLHLSLIQLHAQLSERLGTTTNGSDAEALLREMEEVNFRVMMAGRLLFKNLTAAICEAAKEIESATQELAESIAEVEKIRDIVSSVGKVLIKVDKVLDKIKLI